MRVDAIVPGGHLNYSPSSQAGGGSRLESDAIAMNANINQLQVCRLIVQVGRQNSRLPSLAAPPLFLEKVLRGRLRDTDPSATSLAASSWRICRRLGPRTQRPKEPERAIISKTRQIQCIENEYIRCNWFSKNKIEAR